MFGQHYLSWADLNPQSIFDDTDSSDNGNEVDEPRRENDTCLIIIQRDKYGFGLTLTSKCPAIVYAIRKDSGAHRAGVKPGDAVIRVNGVFVGDRNHDDVVSLISETVGVFAALSVSRRVSSSSSRAAKKQRTTTGAAALCGAFGHRRSTPSISYMDKMANAAEQFTAGRQRRPSATGSVATTLSVYAKRLTSVGKGNQNTRKILPQNTSSVSSFREMCSDRSPQQPNRHRHQQRQTLMHRCSSSSLLKISARQSILNRAENTLNACIRLVPSKTFNKLSENRFGQVFLNSLLRSSSSSSIVADGTLITTNNIPSSSPLSPSSSVQYHLSERSLTSSTLMLPLPSPSSCSNASLQHDSLDGRRDMLASGKNTGSGSVVVVVGNDNHLHSNNRTCKKSIEQNTIWTNEQKKVFNDLNALILTQNQVPLTYFLHFLITQTNDSNYLFFYLFASQYTKKKADKQELLKWAYELHSTFTAYEAPLSIQLPSKIENRITKLLETFDAQKVDEIALRKIFDDSLCFTFAHIKRTSLADFRTYFINRGDSGRNAAITTTAPSTTNHPTDGARSSINGAKDSSSSSTNMASSSGSSLSSSSSSAYYDKSCQLSLIESLLNCYLNEGRNLCAAITTKNSNEHSTLPSSSFYAKTDQKVAKNSLLISNKRQEYDQAYQTSLFLSCVATFIKHCDLKRFGRYDINSLDHFLHRDKQYLFKNSSSQLSKRFSIREKSIKGHCLTQRTFFKVTNCTLCNRLLSGTGPQGFACINCSICLDPFCVMNEEQAERLSECTKSNQFLNNQSSHKKTRGSRFFSQRTGKSSIKDTIDRTREDGLEKDHNIHAPMKTGNGNQNSNKSDPCETQCNNPVVQRSKSDRWPRDKQNDKLTKPNSRSTSNPLMGNSTIEAILMNRISNSMDFHNQQQEQQEQHYEQYPSAQHHRQTTTINEEIGPIASTSIRNSSDVLLDDSDFENDLDSIPSVESVLASNVAQKIPLRQLKRQISIIELYQTEKTHLKNLKILKHIFKDRLSELTCMSKLEIDKIFPQLEQLIEHHAKFKYALRNCQLESIGEEAVFSENDSPQIADVILEYFGCKNGLILGQYCSQFLEDQRTALKIIRNKMIIPDFYNCLRIIEANPLCRKLTLKDFLPCVMSRIAKYKLLFQQILKYTDNIKEKSKLHQCIELADQLNLKVNESVRRQENANLVEEMKSNLFIKMPASGKGIEGVKNGEFEFEKHELIFHSTLFFQWPLKDIELEACLFKDCLVLFQKVPIPPLKANSSTATIMMMSQSIISDSSSESTLNHRYLLQNHYIGHEFGTNMDITVCPILYLDQFMLKKKAGFDNCTFFLVGNGKSCQFLIELRAISKEDRERWFHHVSKLQQEKDEQNDVDSLTIEQQNDPEHQQQQALPPAPETSDNTICCPSPRTNTFYQAPETNNKEVKKRTAGLWTRRSTSDICTADLISKLSNTMVDTESSSIDLSKSDKRSCLLHIISLIDTHGELVKNHKSIVRIEPSELLERIQNNLDKMDSIMNRLISAMTELMASSSSAVSDNKSQERAVVSRRRSSPSTIISGNSSSQVSCNEQQQQQKHLMPQ